MISNCCLEADLIGSSRLGGRVQSFLLRMVSEQRVVDTMESILWKGSPLECVADREWCIDDLHTNLSPDERVVQMEL
jgi:hypothetical protein